jgi:hypothetical protein
MTCFSRVGWSRDGSSLYLLLTSNAHYYSDVAGPDADWTVLFSFGRYVGKLTTDVITIDALKLFAKVVFCEVFLSSRRKYRGTGMFKTVSKPFAHLNFLSGVNCYDIGSIGNMRESCFHGRGHHESVRSCTLLTQDVLYQAHKIQIFHGRGHHNHFVRALF